MVIIGYSLCKRRQACGFVIAYFDLIVVIFIKKRQILHFDAFFDVVSL